MNIEILQSKDGNKTCKIDSIFVHSSYSPVKESQRIAQGIQTNFIPEIIFIVEPCLSYICKDLKEKFPKSKIAVIRIIKEFSEYNSLFDYSFNYFDFQNEKKLMDYIFDTFGENILAFSYLISWEPVAPLLNDQIIRIFNEYKLLIEKCHSILRTRAFFEKRWIKNSFNISKSINKIATISRKGNCNVLVCASGPSLKSVIPFIKKTNPYIIAVSSAAAPLLQNNIVPDIIISTDGGYWAKKHIQKIPKESLLCLAVEGNAPVQIIKNNFIIPIIYNDGIESEIYKSTGLPYINGIRCGTVSGTALFFAKQITSGNIYFSGLDLSITKGFQHTQINNLELLNMPFDNILNSKEKRLCSAEFSNQKISLKIYEDWFSNQENKDNKIYRIINSANNSLGNISDIQVSELENVNFSGEKPIFTRDTFIPDAKRTNKLINFVTNLKSNEYWLKNAFPTDYLNYTHTYDENLKRKLSEKMETETTKLLDRLCSHIIKT